MLSVVLDSEYPDDPNDPTTSGHYLGAQAPLPGSLVTFTPTGGSPVTATVSDAGDTTGRARRTTGSSTPRTRLSSREISRREP